MTEGGPGAALSLNKGSAFPRRKCIRARGSCRE
jgi:hypothetical protein